ncbi:GLPGLI family protein [Chryseobacterium camelliae]|uniref:GLPGLI family protein n=1 Tax=Chryseobacterium camelliae TaxID=1265445 RepID=UPI0028676ABC|nr:GLPGLI family protein [Chryseobacterium camelliae]MDR6514892.1 GLPGLI family protein [Chryseobacterium camelliae]
MKRILTIITTIISMLSFAQKISFIPTLKVTYDSRLQLGEKNNHNQKFILLSNAQSSYFAAARNYLNDTGQYKQTAAIDTRVISDYFQERVIKENNKISVFIRFSDAKIRYEESEPLKWVLYSDTKVINGIKCQMAATNTYGRRWIAYFSREYPISTGPYKFTGLPGLVMEVYDTRDEYHFTAVKIEKDSEEFKFNLSNYKLMSKRNYLQAQYNMRFTLAAFPPIDDENFRRETQKILDKVKIMYNNPLELKPFE